MGAISFARGVPAPECLPVAEFADCAREAIERDGETILNYGPVGGYGPLREWIAERHGVEPGRVLVTNGSLPGLNLVLGHFAEQARILVEAPTYDRPLKIVSRLGVDVRTVSQDDEGIDVDALEQELRRDPSPAFLYVLPTFQNPSGRTLPLERRRRLVELTREHDLLVLEDDPYGRVRYDGEALPTLFELEGGERVLYSSSFSKIVAPGARVGYFVLPADWRREVRGGGDEHLSHAGARGAGDRSTSSSGAGASSRTSSASRHCSRRVATRCSRRSTASFPTARRPVAPRAAISSGSTSPSASTRPSCSARPRPPASRSCKGADFFPPDRGGAAARRDSPSASCRRTRSARACHAWLGLLAPAAA